MPKNENAPQPYDEIACAVWSIGFAYNKKCSKAISVYEQQKNIPNYLLSMFTAGETYKHAISMIDYQPYKDLNEKVIAFTKKIDEDRIKIEKEFQEKLNEDNALFNRTLDELNKCKNRLEEKKYNRHNAPIDRQKAYQAISTLYLNLQKLGEEYFSSDTTVSSFKEKYAPFHKQCLTEIDNAKINGNLSIHRGIEPILIKITNVILSIPLFIATVVNSIQKGKFTPIFFTPGQTHSEKAVDEVSAQLEKNKSSL